MSLVLEPLIEYTNNYNNFGFRKYRSPKMAVGVIRELLKTINYKYFKSLSLKQQKKRIKIITHEGK
jgi:hypothetical protein